jgi:hypothetical protein
MVLGRDTSRATVGVPGTVARLLFNRPEICMERPEQGGHGFCYVQDHRGGVFELIKPARCRRSELERDRSPMTSLG